MARLARIVVPGIPHHVTQRGNRRMEVFFEDGDYSLYLELLSDYCRDAGVAVWAYCLMPNHVHLIMVPSDVDGLRRALSETHRRFARRVNAREEWRGHLWQERFHSYPMDENHLLAAARYIELNPLRAQIVARPGNWPWSSARAHLEGRNDALVSVDPLLDRVENWKAFLAKGMDEQALEQVRRFERTGRPAGSESFVEMVESTTGRSLKPRKPGPKPRHPAGGKADRVD